MKPLVVKLVSMPFAPLDAPSLGLTQLRGVLRRRFGARVTVEIHYAAFEFARQFGGDGLYEHVLSSRGFLTHLGDWLFARAAFPDAPDRAADYLDHYYPEGDAEANLVRRMVACCRASIDSFLDAVIANFHLREAAVVGFTSMFQQTTASLALARRLKEQSPGVITVLGGPAFEGIPGRELAGQSPSMDFVFSGPALESFPRFVGRLLEEDFDALHRIDGVFSQRNWGGGEEARVGLRGEETDINESILPDYEDFLKAHETFAGREGLPYLLFETSRGCWWGEKCLCSFCGLNGASTCYRAMTPANAIRQVQALYPYAKRARCLVATDNILPKGYPEQVFARLRPPPGFRMKLETRVDLDGDALRQLSRAGVVALQPGIESLATPVLRLMRKGTTAFQNLRFLKDCAGLPLVVEWNLLLGSPGESGECLGKQLRDLPRLHHLPAPQGVFPVMFVRHSRYHEEAGANGLALEPQEFYRFIYPFDAASRERLALFFVDRAADASWLDSWLERYGAAVRLWQSRFSNADGRGPARLSLIREGATVRILDARSGERLEHELGAESLRVLELLDEPRSMGMLSRELAGSGIDAGRELAWMEERGLLFEEDGRYLSLVLSSGPGGGEPF